MRRPGVVLVLLVLLGAACGSDQDPTLDLPDAGGSSSSATAAPTTSGARSVGYQVTLTGDAVVPGPGDPDATGTADISLVPDRSEVCYAIEVEGMGAVTAAHLHRAPAGQDGDVVLDLSPNAEEPWEGCAAGNQLLVEELAADPSQFYLQVHDDEHPAGAIRGQLG